MSSPLYYANNNIKPPAPATLRLMRIVRFSSAPQEKGFGRYRQEIEECQAYADELGATIVLTRELTERASIFNRPQFESILQDALKLKQTDLIDGIIIPSVDRLSRDPYDGAAKVRDCLQNGLRVFFAAERLDASDENSQERIIGQLQAAKSYVDRFTANAMAGRRARVLEGKLPSKGGRWPFEYDPATGRCNQIPERVDWVRKWADIIVNGGTLGDCQKLMDKHGVPAPGGGKWNKPTITRILGDRSLIGEFLAFKQRIVAENWWERGKRVASDPVLVYADRENAILTDEVFEKVAARLAENKQISSRNAQRAYGPLRGLLTCYECNRAMGGDGHERYPGFRCPVCRHRISARKLTEAVRTWFQLVLAKPENVEALLMKAAERGDPAKHIQGDLERLEKDLRFEEEKGRRAARLAVYRGGKHEQDFLTIAAEIDEAKDKIRRDIAVRKETLATLPHDYVPSEQEVEEFVGALLRPYENDGHLRQHLVRLGMRVVVEFSDKFEGGIGFGLRPSPSGKHNLLVEIALTPDSLAAIGVSGLVRTTSLRGGADG